MENGYRTGRDVYSGRLYHYEKFCPEWLENTLRDKRIHCSQPETLNDPWDCRPWFNSRSLETPEQIDELLTWMHAINPPTELSPHQIALLAESAHNDRPALERLCDGFSERLYKEICERRIYCLTTDPLSTLMWSHYAGDHSGLCLEFHVGNELFLRAFGLKYLDEYPNWVPHKLDADRALDVVLTKAKCWQYEDEYRLVASPKIPEGQSLRLDGEFLKLPDRSLLSVIVGCKGDYAAVKQIVQKTDSSVRVIKIRRAPSNYQLLMELP